MMTKTGLLILLLIGAVACSPATKKNPNEPSTSDIYVQKGVQYMEKGMLDVALQDFKRALELDKSNGEAHNAIAVLYERMEQPAEAESHFQRALDIDEHNFSAKANYGRFLCGQGRYDAAMEAFRDVIASKVYKSPWIALTNAGICAGKQGKSAEAEDYLRKALAVEPAFPPALYEMAKISVAARQYMSARAFIQRYESVAEPTSGLLLLGIETEQALGNAQGVQEYRNKLSSRGGERR